MTPAQLQNLRNLATPYQRILWVYGEATFREIEEGKAAYERYHTLLRAVCDQFGCRIETACGVFSALSPNNDYHGNVRDARNLFAAKSRCLGLGDFKVHTYGANKRKAWEIAHGADPEKLIVGLKTRSFYFNLLRPTCPENITIDGHMFNIWNGSKLPLSTRNPEQKNTVVNAKTYALISQDVRTAAEWSAMLPNQMQAILWLTWRRLHAIKNTAQETLWDFDAEYAGLGYVRV